MFVLCAIVSFGQNDDANGKAVCDQKPLEAVSQSSIDAMEQISLLIDVIADLKKWSKSMIAS